jgi:CheY-like chemotaxis protein
VVTGTSITSGSNQRRERPLVLLVEDQSDLRRLYAEQLTISGFDVIEAEDGAQAIAHTTGHGPDVVLMDLSLPGIDGWEADAAAEKRRPHLPYSRRRPDRARRGWRAAAGDGRRLRLVRPQACPPDALIAEVRRVLAGLSP